MPYPFIRKISVFGILALLLFAVGCQSEEIPQESMTEEKEVTMKGITVTAPSETALSAEEEESEPEEESESESDSESAEEPEAEEKTESEQEEETESRGLVVIDPGHQAHGNSETEPLYPDGLSSETKAKVSGGTASVNNGYSEYELTLEVSLKLREELENRGYEVLLTRETNEVDISNAERATFANEAGADVFVRIHANGSDNSSANGILTICQTASNPANGDLYEESYALSAAILDAAVEATGANRERIWETDTMVGINWARVPSTIVEMGYMTNPQEDRNLQDPDYQAKLVEGIANGIDRYREEYRSE